MSARPGPCGGTGQLVSLPRSTVTCSPREDGILQQQSAKRLVLSTQWELGFCRCKHLWTLTSTPARRKLRTPSWCPCYHRPKLRRCPKPTPLQPQLALLAE